MSSFGFITIAFGRDRYLRQAENLAYSLRRFMPDTPLAVVTDSSTLDTTLFDQVLPLDTRFGRGVIQKLSLFDCTPFEQTLFIDSDCICLRNFDEFLPRLQKTAFAAVGGKYLQPDQRDEHIKNLRATLNGVGIQRFPKFNGGLYFFNKSASAQRIFEEAKLLYARRDALGIKDFDAAGPNDETLFALAIEKCGGTLFNDGERLMRTPLGATSRIEVEPLDGGCSFIKNGRRFEPALLHFCGPLVRGPEYQFCERVLRTQPSPQDYRKYRRALYWKQTLIGLPRQKVIAAPALRSLYDAFRRLRS